MIEIDEENLDSRRYVVGKGRTQLPFQLLVCIFSYRTETEQEVNIWKVSWVMESEPNELLTVGALKSE